MQGWPEHMQDFPIKAGQEITVTSDQSATATATLLPINHPARTTCLTDPNHALACFSCMGALACMLPVKSNAYQSGAVQPAWELMRFPAEPRRRAARSNLRPTCAARATSSSSGAT